MITGQEVLFPGMQVKPLFFSGVAQLINNDYTLRKE